MSMIDHHHTSASRVVVFWINSLLGSPKTEIVVNTALSQKKENKMKPSNKDELKGKVHEVKGSIKETVGQVTDNPKLEVEGHVEKAAGTFQKKVGQVEKVLEKK